MRSTFFALFVLVIALSGCDTFSDDDPGYRLAFVSSQYLPTKSLSRVNILDLGTGELRTISSSESGILQFRTSADGSTLAWMEYDASGNQTIFTADADGRIVAQFPFHGGYEGGLSLLSSDGSFLGLSFTANGAREVSVVNRDGTGLRQLTDAGLRTYPIAFSNDGQKLLFRRVRPGGQGHWDDPDDLFVINTDGSGLQQITDDPAGIVEATFSPDGSKVLFTRRREAGVEAWETNVFLVNADGSGLNQLTDEPHNNFHLHFSPDGSRLVYITALGEAGHVLHVANSDGSNARVLSSNSRVFDQISFSPDGSKLIAESWAGHGAGKGAEAHEAACAGKTPAAAEAMCFSGDIVEIDVASGDVRLLTTDDADDAAPVYSLDGRMIASWRYEPHQMHANAHIAVMDADGHGLRNVTRDTTWTFSTPRFIAR